MAGTVEDLLVRAALDIAGVQRGTREMVRELSRAREQIEQSFADTALPDLTSDARQQAEAAADAFAGTLAEEIEAEGARVAEALESTIGGAAEAVSEAVRQSASEAAQAMEGLQQATGSVAPEPRDWQEWAAQVRAANQAAREASAAQQTLAQDTRETVIQTRLSAEEIERLEQQYAARQAARRQAQVGDAAAAARAQAIAQGEALRRQLENDRAQIRLAQLDQLLKPREAAEAARISAEAYNRELRRVIAQADAAGAFRGRQGQEAFNELVGSISNLDRQAARSTGGLARLNNSMVVLARQAAGAHPVVGQLVDAVGTFALGTGVMVGVLAGLAALAAAWNKITEESREAKRQQEEALDSLRRLQRQREIERLGPGGEAVRDVGAAIERRDAVRAEIERLDAQIAAAFASMDELQLQAVQSLQRRRARLQAEYEEIAALVSEGEEEIARRLRRAAQDLRRQEASNLAALVASNDATAAEYARAREIIEQELNRFAQLGQLGQLSLDPAIVAERASILATVQQLTRALEGPTRQLNAAETAAARLADTMREIAVTSALGLVDVGDLPDNIREAFQESEQLRSRLDALQRTLEDVRRAGGEVPEAAEQAVERLQQAIAEADAELQGLVDRLGLGAANVATLAVTIGGITIDNPEEVERRYREQVRRRLEQEVIRARLNLELQPVTTFAERMGIQVPDPEGIDALNETLEAVNNVTAGFEDLASALGDVDRVTAAALSGIGQAIRGFSAIREGAAMGGTIGALTQVSGVLSIAGAVAGVVTSIGESARQAQIETLRFQRAMADWRRELSGSITGLDRAFLDARAQFESVTGRQITGDTPAEFIVSVRRWIDALRQAEQTFGAFAGEADRLEEALALFEEQVRRNIESLRLFEDSLEGRRRERDIRDRLLGIDRSAQQQIEAVLGDIRAIAPGFWEEFFAGVDPSDIEAVRSAAAQAFDTIASLTGEELLAILDDLAPEEVLQLFEVLADHMADFDAAIRDTTTQIRGFGGIFNYTLASIRAAGTREFVPQQQSDLPAQNFVPPPGISSRTDAGGSAVSVRVEPGAVVVDASTSLDIGDSVVRSLTDAVVEGMRRGGSTVTPQMIEQIRRQLKDSLQRAAAQGSAAERALARDWPGQ